MKINWELLNPHEMGGMLRFKSAPNHQKFTKYTGEVYKVKLGQWRVISREHGSESWWTAGGFLQTHGYVNFHSSPDHMASPFTPIKYVIDKF